MRPPPLIVSETSAAALRMHIQQRDCIPTAKRVQQVTVIAHSDNVLSAYAVQCTALIKGLAAPKFVLLAAFDIAITSQDVRI